MHILVTGATGYVGGRLIPALLEAGHTLRCLVRNPGAVTDMPWTDHVEVVQGDVLKPDTLPPALADIEVAYYLIHSLGSGSNFAERDAQAARDFGDAAHAAGVQRIIYLGGLLPKEEPASKHLASRAETGDALRASGVPVTEFRAAQVIGSGSLSFELIRHMTERVPLMICPGAVRTRAQPIATPDLICYLTQALTVPESTGRILEIGGQDVLSYADLFRLYAQVRGLKRVVVPIPILAPKLASYWAGLMTPIPFSVAYPLFGGLRNEVVVRDHTAQELFDIDPMPLEAALRLALDRNRDDRVAPIWHADYPSHRPDDVFDVQFAHKRGMRIERRMAETDAAPARVFQVVTRLGGQQGWLYADFLWSIRGMLDALVGGIGLRRGRRSPTTLRVGDVVDFWRVEALEPNRLLRLSAEMKLPGRAWLQFELDPLDGGRTCLTQTAFFDPKGLAGLLYWYATVPAHFFVFPGMLDAIIKRAEAEDTPAVPAGV